MSDHFSGPRAIAGPQCDICDVYAFPSPERPGNLVMVINVVPRATETSSFSDAVIYRCRLRAASIAALGPKGTIELTADDITFDCLFDARVGAQPQQGRCITPAGDIVPFVVNDVASGHGSGVRVYAGLRSEPFFLDFDGLDRSLKSGTLQFTQPGQLTGPGANIMSIVIEADGSLLRRGGSGSLFAFVGETITTGKLPIRLERMGRPEVKNVLLGPKNRDTVNRDLEVRDLYNLEDPFHIGPDYRNVYRARLNGNLAYMDSLDGRIGWPLDADGAHPLTDFVLADFLLVDIAKPYAEDSFLEIEQSMLKGHEHRSCGGRSVNDDVMDTFYTLYIGGLDSARISDGVDEATKRAPKTFPYLAEPNPYTEIARPGQPDPRSKPQAQPAVKVVGVHHHDHAVFGKYQL